MQWLHDAGHDCHILTTARFESRVPFTVEDHLAQQGVDRPRLAPSATRRQRPRAARPVVRYAVGGVPVTLLLTRHNDETRPDPAETTQYLALVDELLRDVAPDQVIACNGHPMI